MSKKDATQAQAPEPEEGAAPQEEVTPTAETLAAEHLAGWQRALADYENLKRQVQVERGEFVKYASQQLIQDLLPTLDYFDAATAHLPSLERCDEATTKEIQNWFTGIQHVQKLLIDRLSESGLVVIEPSGLFNPNEQEAAEERVSEEPEGTILQVLAKGYRLHDKLIRPARVIIATSSTQT